VADALVALTILSMVLALVLNSGVQALRSSSGALNRRFASAEAEYRLMTEWPQLNKPGDTTGAPAGSRFRWRIKAQAVEALAAGGPGLCAVSSNVTAKGSGRTYTLETVRFCGGTGTGT
jgi:hypothetical protein